MVPRPSFIWTINDTGSMAMRSALKDGEAEPFLENQNMRESNGESSVNSRVTFQDGERRPLRDLSRSLILLFTVLQVVLLAAHGIIFYHFTYQVQRQLQRQCQLTNDSPNGLCGLQLNHYRDHYIRYQDSPYTGDSNEEIDQAWSLLLRNMTIRVTEEELSRGNQSSIELPYGGYMAWLGVYHELHCVKYIQEYKKRQYYFPNLTESEDYHLNLHVDHCIEMLRSAALCRADTSLTTFVWTGKPRPELDTHRPLHTCVDWAVLENSLSDRVVTIDELVLLRNPNSDDGGDVSSDF